MVSFRNKSEAGVEMKPLGAKQSISQIPNKAATHTHTRTRFYAPACISKTIFLTEPGGGGGGRGAGIGTQQYDVIPYFDTGWASGDHPPPLEMRLLVSTLVLW